MQTCIMEQERRIPVFTSCDVAVVGGGIAGVSAALAAARHGKKVLLLERMFSLGGLATLGLVTIYLPLCDGNGRQVSFGIAEELFRLSIQDGYETDYPDTWLEPGKKEHGLQRFQVRYNAQIFAARMEQMLKRAGVEILYGTTVTQVKREENRITALFIENKSGRQAVLPRSVIDCTGDADICVYAGAPTALYAKKNAMAAWYYETANGETELQMLGAADVVPEDEDAKIPESVPGERISGIDAKEVSEMMCHSHTLSVESFLKKGKVSQHHSLTTLAQIPQLRMTRRLRGAYELDEKEQHIPFDDSIGMTGDWRKRGPVYELPFRTLYTPELVNLAVAGRCISVTDEMWDISRVIPPCAVTGQAAGTAFAMTEDLTQLNMEELQQMLRQDGVVLHESELSY